MTWQEALEIVIAQTKHERYRALCDEAHADHLKWRRHILGLAGGDPESIALPASEETPREYPSLAKMALSFFREMMAFARSGGKIASKSIRTARLAECVKCEWFDRAQRRCRKCGCANSAKVYIAVAQCPLDPPKWRAIESPGEPSQAQSPSPVDPSN